jgi:adenosyl cobinamide kinase/adenosyl cobinamide phosphate guanylyltransferase
MGRMIFITGPVRSGKSRRAVDLACEVGGDNVVFVATWRPDATDAEMSTRVDRHRAERPAIWRTLEAPAVVEHALRALAPAPEVVLLDCLTLWASDRLDHDDDSVIEAWRSFLADARGASWATIVVGNEIGWSPVPSHPVARRFRDLVGRLAQETAAASDDAWLMVAGCPLRLR